MVVGAGWRVSEAEIMAAARSDPDAEPTTAEQIKNARLVPRVKTLRRALRLTRKGFAARYPIQLGTIRGWEQGVAEPDATARGIPARHRWGC